MIKELTRIEQLLECSEYNWDKWCEQEADSILENFKKLSYGEYRFLLEGKRSDILKSPVSWGDILDILSKMKIDYEKL